MSVTKQSAFSDNSAGALAYLTPVPAIAFLVLVPYKKNPVVRFHAWQSILLGFFAIAINYLLNFILGMLGMHGFLLAVPVTMVVGILWLSIWLFCAIRALYGRKIKLPLIGPFAEKQASE